MLVGWKHANLNTKRCKTPAVSGSLSSKTFLAQILESARLYRKHNVKSIICISRKNYLSDNCFSIRNLSLTPSRTMHHQKKKVALNPTPHPAKNITRPDFLEIQWNPVKNSYVPTFRISSSGRGVIQAYVFFLVVQICPNIRAPVYFWP